MSGPTKEYTVVLQHARSWKQTVTIHAECPDDAKDQIDQILTTEFILATGEPVETTVLSVKEG
jgi:hypothetical protein